MKRSNYTNSEDDLFGPGIDLTVSLSAILLAVLFIGARLYEDVTIDKDNFKSEVSTLERENKELQDIITELETNSPPNMAIVIEDVTQYTFPSGEAELPEELREFVRNELVDKIEENVEKFEISVVEVIGHTDGQILAPSYGNLDDMLERVANDTASIEELQASSNAGLGMVRALSVVRELQKIQREEGRLQKLDSKKGFRAYSAAQLTLTSGELSQPNLEPDASRRRIEIRFIRSRPGKTSR